MAMIKAIQTEYNGIKFRSRLEARWAVFFDAVGVTWEYEPEGFEFSNGIRYLPDFLLHGVEGRGSTEDGDLYIEVKGELQECDKKKIDMFSVPLVRPILVVGNIPNGNCSSIGELFCDAINRSDDGDYFYNLQFADADYYHAIPAINKKGKFELFGIDWDWDKYDFEATTDAYNKARNAKFEKFSNEPMTKQQYASNRADTLEGITEEERKKLRSRKTWVSIPHSWGSFFKQSDSDTVKRMVMGILDYSQTGEEPDFVNDDEKSIFGAFFKPVLDKDFDDYCYKQNRA